jgi:Fe-S cluster assembly iron-binding protein IscA
LNLTITQAAARKILGIMAEKGGNLALRIKVGRGLTGESWNMTFEPRTAAAELVDGVLVAADSATVARLEEMVIDWVNTAQGAGFGVYDRNLRDPKVRQTGTLT